MAVIAVETALRNPNNEIHFGAPTQAALRKFIIPIFNRVLTDCPESLRPEWKQFAGRYAFKNGSYITLCGCNNKQYDNLRGNKSDLFILDEGAQIDELEYVVKDIALPQLLSSDNPYKRIIIPSTPPVTPDHSYLKYAETAQGRGAYSVYTIDESWYPKAEIDKMIEEMGGRQSTTVRRELYCEFVTDEKLHIIPEWRNHPEFTQEVVKDDYFSFFYLLEGMDVGYRDYTAHILGYWDFNRSKLIIEYEYALRENEFTTEKLAHEIKQNEKEYKQINQTRIKRIADNNNLNILADLARLYKLPFSPVSKKNGKSWMVNQLRQFVKSGKLIIHPRCKKLIASLEFGIWKKGLDEFARSPELGHYDFVDALIYMVAVLLPTIQNVNPIPPLYKLNVTNMMFPNGMPAAHQDDANDAIKKMFPKLNI
jgi:hypothetical protein